jgi:DNA-binding IclR family transcriptional regulator
MVPIQSIKRALDALDHIALQALRGEAAALQAISEHLGLAAPTAHNIVKTLVACGYASRDSRGLYSLGPKCADIARSARFGGGLIETAAQVVHALAESTGESVVLATLAQGRRHLLLRAEGDAVVRVAGDVEEGGSLYDKVTGRVLAAYAAPDELSAIVAAQGLPGADWDGIADLDHLHAALQRVRQAALCEDRNERTGVRALAVPVLDTTGRLLAALGLYLPVFRADDTRLELIRTDLRAAAERLGGTQA